LTKTTGQTTYIAPANRNIDTVSAAYQKQLVTNNNAKNAAWHALLVSPLEM